MSTLANITRDSHGIPHIQSDSEEQLYRAIGHCHASDRSLSMLLMRILGQGRGSELLEASEQMLGIDKFFRRMNWSDHIAEQETRLSPRARAVCQAYCDGVNQVWKDWRPWEFALLGYRPEPWQVADSILLSRMMGYLTLAQSQGEVERLFMEMVLAGLSRDKLEALFPGRLDGCDLELLQKVKLGERLVAPHLLWNTGVPKLMASNNWVIAGSRTASGKPILASDPHLETNRLPNVWYEMAVSRQGRYLMGSSIPGLPGILIGRSQDIAWGATYSFMDAVDSWVEECKNGNYLRDGTWQPFQVRKEVIRRKNKQPVEVVFYENGHGVLDGDPHQPGFYLATAWTSSKSGAVSLEAMLQMFDAANAEQGMELLGRLETAWNWVVADRHGNIGYQMSGLMPKRRPGVSGFFPLPGWLPENDWQGLVDINDLPRCYNPAQGYFATANNDLNDLGKQRPINMCMGGQRARRIAAMIEARKNDRLTPQDIFVMHMDVLSLQAEEYMALLRPLLPDTQQAAVLKEWDCRYTPESLGATLFEAFYRQLVVEVFGNNGLGRQVIGHLLDETDMVTAFFDNFDRVLLRDESPWFGGETREAIYRRVLEKVLSQPVRRWGENNRITMTHLLLGGKLPKFLGFDRGPVPLRGGRATVHQGQVYRSAGRTSSFAPSMRLVTDMADDVIHTCLAGGPVDRRFSPWYCSELDNWLHGRYKQVKP